ncbi:MAG: pyridoxal-phosphate-dependent aminotransferase family protein [Candidatus Odinarchaeota archaeon]
MYDEELTTLMIPGPVPVHPRVYRAMSRVLYGHRTKEYQTTYKETVALLQRLLHTEQDVLIFAGSGTAAMEAAIANAIEPGEKVLNVVNGKFSERWSELTTAFGAQSLVQEFAYGQAAEPEAIRESLASDQSIRVVTICHNETSTGVLNPAKEIGQIVRDYDRLFIVDGITSVGGDYVYPDKWNFDLLVTGSQKCLGVPPGLGMIWVGPRAWKKIETRKQRNPTYYLDLLKAKNRYDGFGDSPFTSAISLMYGLHESLTIMFEEGYEQRIERHHRLGRITRAGYLGMGLDLLADPAYYSNTVTAVKYPSGITDKEFRAQVRNLGILIAGGQGPVKGKIWRTNHMNICTERDVLATIAIIEIVLKRLGYEVPIGSGVLAAQEQLLKEKF